MQIFEIFLPSVFPTFEISFVAVRPKFRPIGQKFRPKTFFSPIVLPKQFWVKSDHYMLLKSKKSTPKKRALLGGSQFIRDLWQPFFKMKTVLWKGINFVSIFIKVLASCFGKYLFNWNKKSFAVLLQNLFWTANFSLSINSSHGLGKRPGWWFWTSSIAFVKLTLLLFFKSFSNCFCNFWSILFRNLGSSIGVKEIVAGGIPRFEHILSLCFKFSGDRVGGSSQGL